VDPFRGPTEAQDSSFQIISSTKVLLPGGTRLWDFVVFGGDFDFSGCFFLVIHTNKNSKNLYTLNASDEGRCWHKNFTCYLCRFLPSIFNTSSSIDTTYAIFHILPGQRRQNVGL
jgi:hypothetical protein